MCSSSAFFRQDAGEDLLLEDVMHLQPQGKGYRLVGLLGDEKVLDDARLLEIDFESNRIIFGPND